MPTSHPIRIRIYGIDNALVNEATVTLTLPDGTSETSDETNSSGEVVLNVANAGDWNVSDEVTILATKTGVGRKTETLVLTSSPQTTSLTLEETSDLYYSENEEGVHVLNFSLLTTFDGEKVTNSNRLPVSSETMLNEPKLENTYDSRNRLSTQTITIRGTQYSRTFTYTGNDFQFTKRSAWTRL